MRILVTDDISSRGLEILRRESDIEVEVRTGLNQEELMHILPGFDAVITRSSTAIDARLLENAKRLKVIARGGVGIDNIDIEAASRQGIVVMNTPSANTLAATEHTMALLLALCRDIARADRSLKEHLWDRKSFMGVQLYHKTMGIIGFGRIGSRVGVRCRAFEMEVIAYDPYIKAEKATSLGVRLVEFHELLENSDFITLHVPLTDETRGMIGAKEIQRMKAGVRLINCARGGIIDEDALYEALKSGKVAGAALDVFYQEPATSNKLLELPNVIVTPHLGASTTEAQDNVAIEVANQVIQALREENFHNAVNMPITDGRLFAEMKPFFDLAERIGALHIQLVEGRIETVEVEYHGKCAQHVKPLTVALLKGLLQPILGETVNYVNAPYLAQERAIRVSQTRSTGTRDYANLITARVVTDKSQCLISGTLFSHLHPRIVQIDNYGMDALPAGHMLVLINRDCPGVVGKVGTILGDHQINIGEWRLGRGGRGGTALSVINLDSPVPKEVLAQVKALDSVLDVKQVVLPPLIDPKIRLLSE